MSGLDLERRCAAAYARYAELLLRVARRNFHLDDAEAEEVLQEVFLAFCIHAARVRDERSWLIGATCNASRAARRRRARYAPLRDEEREAPAWCAVSALTVGHVLRRVSARSGRILRWKYLDGCTTSEVAQRLRTTEGYAEQLVVRALREARLSLT